MQKDIQISKPNLYTENNQYTKMLVFMLWSLEEGFTNKYEEHKPIRGTKCLAESKKQALLDTPWIHGWEEATNKILKGALCFLIYHYLEMVYRYA